MIREQEVPMRQQQSLQHYYASESICFGCGPANSQGLHVQSFVKQDRVIADWYPQKHHQAFPGILNGGIIGTLLDCHANWTAAYHLMQYQQLERPPCTVTADYQVQLLKPTPVDEWLHLQAWVTVSELSRVTVKANLEVKNQVYDTLRGVFIAVEPGHPAYPC